MKNSGGDGMNNEQIKNERENERGRDARVEWGGRWGLRPAVRMGEDREEEEEGEGLAWGSAG